MNMKKLFAVILILCVAVTMFVACGEKKEEPTTDTTTTETTTTDTTTTTENTTEKPADTTTPAATGTFENAIFTATLPETWTATDDGTMTVTMSKKDDPASAITVLYNAANTDTVDTIATGMAAGAPVEDMTIGANKFKKFTVKVQDKEKTNLVIVKGSNGAIFTVENINGADEQAILNSIILK
jgi:hypothetical protein